MNKNEIQMAPYETHFKFFKKFKKRLNGGKILSISLEEDELILRIKTSEEEFDMILNVEQYENKELKIGGMMLD